LHIAELASFNCFLVCQIHQLQPWNQTIIALQKSNPKTIKNNSSTKPSKSITHVFDILPLSLLDDAPSLALTSVLMLVFLE